MPTLCTIGHNQKSLEQFIQLLQEAGVDAVVDIRLRNTSQLSGFAKRDDLAFLLYLRGVKFRVEQHVCQHIQSENSRRNVHPNPNPNWWPIRSDRSTRQLRWSWLRH